MTVPFESAQLKKKEKEKKKEKNSKEKEKEKQCSRSARITIGEVILPIFLVASTLTRCYCTDPSLH